MDTLGGQVSTQELRRNLSQVLDLVQFAGERVGVTRNGKLAAAIVSVADVEALDAYEDALDATAYAHWKALDDGVRIDFDELLAKLASNWDPS